MFGRKIHPWSRSFYRKILYQKNSAASGIYINQVILFSGSSVFFPPVPEDEDRSGDKR